MSKSYLNRIVDSFAKDFSKQNEEQARETITKNVKELADTGRIHNLLRQSDTLYNQQILRQYILETLLEQPNTSAAEQTIISHVQNREQEILKEAASEDCFQYASEPDLDVLKTVLEVAIEDSYLSGEELKLIRHLREKLNLNVKDKYLLLAQLNHYPKEGNVIHSPSEFNTALLELQKLGVVFYCNQHQNEPMFVIPDEIISGVKAAIHFELSKPAYRLLLEKLQVSQLRRILENEEIKKSGTKGDIIQRILDSEIQPSQALGILSDQELYELCNNLPGAIVSGSKHEKIDRVINYFDELTIKESSDKSNKDEKYYGYLVELAKRDHKNLINNNVIKKERDIERAFERGTTYLFSEKLGLDVENMEGSEHADGSVSFGKNERFLWDNKSKEEAYSFPNSHVRQFKRYIRDSAKRVNCFLVIVPEIASDAEKNAYRLKVESQSDTDVGLIRAEDLKWVAEQWREYSKNDKFNLEVFNITGILHREDLVKRMELFL